MDNAIYYGFRPRRPRFGAFDFPMVRGRVATAYQSAVAGTPDVNIGDPVSLVSDGTFAHSAAGGGAGIYGIVGQIFPYWNGSVLFPDNKLPYGQGAYGTNLARQTFIGVIPVAAVDWEIDVNDATTATTEATYKPFLGENADHVYAAAAFNNGIGAFPRLNISGHNTTPTLQWRIIDIAEEVNIDFSGLYVKLIVQCNVVQESPWVPTGV